MAESTLDPEITPTDELERLVVHVQRAQHNGLYFVASPTPDQSTVAALIADRFANTGRDDVREVVLSADNLNLIGFLRGLRMPDGKGMVIAYGLDALSPKLRVQAYGHMNLGREFLRVAGYRVVVIASQDILTDLSLNAPDFFAWRSITAEIALPTDSAQREQLISQLQLRAASDQHDPIQALRDRYLQSVATSLGWLDFRGLSQVRNMMRVKLLDVFTPLTVTQTQSDTRSAPFLGRNRRRSAIEKPDFEVMREWAERPHTVQVSLDEAVREQTRLVILGDPGSGKSTALRRIALLCANQRNPANAGINFAQPLLPILMPISSYAQWLQPRPANDAADTLMQFLPHYFAQLGLPNLATLFETHIHNGSAIMLLDGMDEVPTLDVRQRIRRQIDMFCAAHPKNRVLVSSRIAGYDTTALGSDFTVLTIAPFDRDDITRFTQQWSAAYEAVTADCAPNALPPEAQLRAERRAANLSEAIFANPSIERLAQTPLLLTLLALIHEQGARLPNRRIELYKLCVEALAETWNRARSLTGNAIELLLGERRLDARLVTDLLSPLAYAAQVRQPGGLMGRDWLIQKLLPPLQQHLRCTPAQASAFANEFVGLLREQIGILVERAPDQFGWLHLTFGEYLAAVFLSRKANALDMLKPRLHDPRWREVILLTAAALEGDYAEHFVHGILHANSPWEDLLHFDLLLAARCVGDQIIISEKDKTEILKQIFLLLINHKKLFSTVDNDFIFNEISDIFIFWPQQDKNIIANKCIQIMLNDTSWLKRSASAKALSVIMAEGDEVQKSLLKAFRDKDSSVRGVVAKTLGVIKTDNIDVQTNLLNAVISDSSYFVRMTSAKALGAIKDNRIEIQTNLLKVLGSSTSSSTCNAVITALSAIKANDIETQNALLIAIENDRDPYVQIAAAILLGELKINTLTLQNKLLIALNNQYPAVRNQAAKILGAIKASDPKVIEELSKAIRDEDIFVRISATKALSEIKFDGFRIEQQLLIALEDKDYFVRSAAAEGLGKVKDPSNKSIKSLLISFSDADYQVRMSSAKALGEIKASSYKIQKKLLSLLNDRSSLVRGNAAEAFKQILSLHPIEIDSSILEMYLMEILYDRDDWVRSQAVLTISLIKNHPEYQLMKKLDKNARRRNLFFNDLLYELKLIIPADTAHELLWHLAPKWWADRSDELAVQES